MSDYSGLGDLVDQIKEVSRNIELGDARTDQRLDAIEKSIDDLYLKTGRPGGYGGGRDNADFARKDAAGLCVVTHNLTVPQNHGHRAEYTPSSAEIDEALTARKGLLNLFRHGDANRLGPTERKSLSSFTFGTTSFILPPAMSNRVLSCIVDPTDISGLFDVVTISAPSIRFLLTTCGWPTRLGIVR